MARRSRTPLTRLLVAVVASAAVVMVAPVAATAQDAPTPPPTLGSVLDGEAPGLSATATSDFARVSVDADRPDMQVVVEVANDTGADAVVAVPFGTLLATEDEADQTVAVGGPAGDPTLARVAAAGGTPELTAPPGESSHTLVVYCTEADDGAPFEPTPLHHLGTAQEPLPTVLRQIAVRQPTPEVAQEAVWWVTDDATTPVPAELVPLLEGVDTDAFAADPHRVVPATGYSPRWARAGVIDESFDSGRTTDGSLPAGGVGLGGLIWVLAALVAVIAAVAITARAGRARTATATVARPAGWYADPWGIGHQRWWDGRTWTARTQGHR